MKAAGDEYQSLQRINFSISIAGDLDSREHDDIISALETVDSFMKEASSVTTADLKAMAEKLGNLDSLSSLSVFIQVEESMKYEHVQSAVSEVDDTAVNEEKDLKNVDKLDNALERILNSGKKHGKAPGMVNHHMDDYLSGILDSFSKESEKNGYNHEVGELIKKLIINRLA